MRPSGCVNQPNAAVRGIEREERRRAGPDHVEQQPSVGQLADAVGHVGRGEPSGVGTICHRPLRRQSSDGPEMANSSPARDS